LNVPYEVGVGLLLGFSLTVPPGPMNALIASRSVRSLTRGVMTGLGAMSADAMLAALVFTLSATVHLTQFIRPVYAVGCMVMGYLGYRTLASRPSAVEPSDQPARTYSSALLVGLSNPFQILWWLTAGIGFAYYGGWVLFLGLFGAIATWVVAFPYVLSVSTRRYPRLARWVTLGSGVIMVAFAVFFAYLAL
jgi:threonine/homoserine/homoserine lactone efflux protein